MVLAGHHSDCRCSEIYKSRYVTKRAEQLPQKLKTEAATITAVVVPAALIIEPIDRDKMNCARNTILKITTTKIGWISRNALFLIIFMYGCMNQINDLIFFCLFLTNLLTIPTSVPIPRMRPASAFSWDDLVLSSSEY